MKGKRSVGITMMDVLKKQGGPQVLTKRKEGFTLVELIVVIVILGILAAVAIPALTGYIDRADDQKVIAETRQCVVAAQSLATERHGTDRAVADGTIQDPIFISEVLVLAETPAGGTIDYMVFKGSILLELSYTNYGTTVIYKDGQYTIKGTDPDPDPPAPEFSDVRGLTGEAKTAAIKENAQALTVAFNNALAQAFAAAGTPQPTASWNKGAIQIAGLQNSSALWNSSLVRMTTSATIDPGSYIKPVLDAQGVHIGYSWAYFRQVSTSGYTRYDIVPYKIVFRGNTLTGGTSSTGIYTYFTETGELVQGEA